MTRGQLLELGFRPDGIKHRLDKRRLHRVRRGVYAVGRPELTQCGAWIAAVLSCGDAAVLSHHAAAALWQIGRVRGGRVDVTIPHRVRRAQPGVVLHRRAIDKGDSTVRHRIPVTTPVRTLLDLAELLSRDDLEAAINAADKLRLADPESVRSDLEESGRHPGLAALRETLDRHAFTLTDSELERRFLPLIRHAGLPSPRTGGWVNGCKVDFYWPDLGLIVETDGLRYHRTRAQQTTDRLRDQIHTAAGLTALRFTHAQVAFEPDHVAATLTKVAKRLGRNQLS